MNAAPQPSHPNRAHRVAGAAAVVAVGVGALAMSVGGDRGESTSPLLAPVAEADATSPSQPPLEVDEHLPATTMQIVHESIPTTSSPKEMDSAIPTTTTPAAVESAPLSPPETTNPAVTTSTVEVGEPPVPSQLEIPDAGDIPGYISEFFANRVTLTNGLECSGFTIPDNEGNPAYVASAYHCVEGFLTTNTEGQRTLSHDGYINFSNDAGAFGRAVAAEVPTELSDVMLFELEGTDEAARKEARDALQRDTVLPEELVFGDVAYVSGTTFGTGEGRKEYPALYIGSIPAGAQRIEGKDYGELLVFAIPTAKGGDTFDKGMSGAVFVNADQKPIGAAVAEDEIGNVMSTHFPDVAINDGDHTYVYVSSFANNKMERVPIENLNVAEVRQEARAEAIAEMREFISAELADETKQKQRINGGVGINTFYGENGSLYVTANNPFIFTNGDKVVFAWNEPGYEDDMNIMYFDPEEQNVVEYYPNGELPEQLVETVGAKISLIDKSANTLGFVDENGNEIGVPTLDQPKTPKYSLAIVRGIPELVSVG